MDLRGRRVLTIGGAGFLGSHIIDQLLQDPVREIVVLDNFVRGSRANLRQAGRDDRVRIVEGSFADLRVLSEVMRDTDQNTVAQALMAFYQGTGA